MMRRKQRRMQTSGAVTGRLRRAEFLEWGRDELEGVKGGGVDTNYCGQTVGQSAQLWKECLLMQEYQQQPLWLRLSNKTTARARKKTLGVGVCGGGGGGDSLGDQRTCHPRTRTRRGTIVLERAFGFSWWVSWGILSLWLQCPGAEGVITGGGGDASAVRGHRRTDDATEEVTRLSLQRQDSASRALQATTCTLCREDEVLLNPDHTIENSFVQSLLFLDASSNVVMTCGLVQSKLPSQQWTSDDRACRQVTEELSFECVCQTASSSQEGNVGEDHRQKQKMLTWLGRSSAVVSAVCSLWVMWKRPKDNTNKLQFWFGLLGAMSAVSLLSAVVWAFGSLPIPTQEGGWTWWGAHGTQTTCAMQGFLLQLGGVGGAFYAFLVSLYGLMRVRGFSDLLWQSGVPGTDSRKWVLLMCFHGTAILAGLALAGAGIPYYQAEGGSGLSWVCYIQAPPAESSYLQALVFSVVPTWLCLMGAAACLGLAWHGIRRREQGQDNKDHSGNPKHLLQTVRTNSTDSPPPSPPPNDSGTNARSENMLVPQRLSRMMSEPAISSSQPASEQALQHQQQQGFVAARAPRRGSAVAARGTFQMPHYQSQSFVATRAPRRGSSVAATGTFQMQQQHSFVAARAPRRGSSVAAQGTFAIPPQYQQQQPAPSSPQPVTRLTPELIDDEEDDKPLEKRAENDQDEVEWIVLQCACFGAAYFFTWPLVTVVLLTGEHTDSDPYTWWNVVAVLAPLQGFFNCIVFEFVKPKGKTSTDSSISLEKTRALPSTPPLADRGMPRRLPSSSSPEQAPHQALMAPFDAVATNSDDGDNASMMLMNGEHDGAAGGGGEGPYVKQAAPGVFQVQQEHEVRHIQHDDGNSLMSVSSVTESFCDDAFLSTSSLGNLSGDRIDDDDEDDEEVHLQLEKHLQHHHRHLHQHRGGPEGHLPTAGLVPDEMPPGTLLGEDSEATSRVASSTLSGRRVPSLPSSTQRGGGGGGSSTLLQRKGESIVAREVAAAAAGGPPPVSPDHSSKPTMMTSDKTIEILFANNDNNNITDDV